MQHLNEIIDVTLVRNTFYERLQCFLPMISYGVNEIMVIMIYNHMRSYYFSVGVSYV
jgi:hypothetical protein